MRGVTSTERLSQGTDGAERLLAAARRLFVERGFLGASIHEIVRAADVSRPVLYYHFGSKKGLYLAVARKVAGEYQGALDGACGEAAPVVEKIRRVCRAHVAARGEWALIGVAARIGPGDDSEPAKLDGRLTRVVECVQSLVGEGIKEGELNACDAAVAALVLVGAAEAVLGRWPSRSSDLAACDRLDEVLGFVLKGLAPQVGS